MSAVNAKPPPAGAAAAAAAAAAAGASAGAGSALASAGAGSTSALRSCSPRFVTVASAHSPRRSAVHATENPNWREEAPGAACGGGCSGASGSSVFAIRRQPGHRCSPSSGRQMPSPSKVSFSAYRRCRPER